MFYYSWGSDADQGLDRAGAVHGLSNKIDKKVSAPKRSKNLLPARIELVRETKAHHPP
jgi:hypothetical protein